MPSQINLPLVQSPFGEYSSWFFVIPTAHTSLLGVTMIPCINPSSTLKVMPSGGVCGLPFLSNTVRHWPPYELSHALSLASTAAPKVPPCMPPPVKPVVMGETGVPFGPNLVAGPCQSASCACQPMVKLSPTQRFPS